MDDFRIQCSVRKLRTLRPHIVQNENSNNSFYQRTLRNEWNNFEAAHDGSEGSLNVRVVSCVLVDQCQEVQGQGGCETRQHCSCRIRAQIIGIICKINGMVCKIIGIVCKIIGIVILIIKITIRIIEIELYYTNYQSS